MRKGQTSEVPISEGDGSPKVTAAEPWGTCLRVDSGHWEAGHLFTLPICLGGQ